MPTDPAESSEDARRHVENLVLSSHSVPVGRRPREQFNSWMHMAAEFKLQMDNRRMMHRLTLLTASERALARPIVTTSILPVVDGLFSSFVN